VSADTYGPADAARLLGVSARRVRQLVDAGQLQAVGRDPLRIDARSLLQLRDERRSGTTVPTPAAETGQAEQVATILAAALQTVEAAAERVESVYRERLAIADRTEQALRDELAAERAKATQLQLQLEQLAAEQDGRKRKRRKRRKDR